MVTMIQPPLVAHVIYRLDYGGLENGLVNLINRMPPDRYRHAIVCLTDFNLEFRRRIRREDVAVYALQKRAGQDWGLYWRCRSLFRQLRPAIVHTRNLAAMEMQVSARWAGVKARVHGEHGWDCDPAVMNPRYHQLRRWLRPLVSHYIALSGEITDYLKVRIGVASECISRIINGVDIARFYPGHNRSLLPAGFAPEGALVIGTVGRLEKVKDQTNLVRAFIALLQTMPDARNRLRLVVVGEGSLHAEIERLLAATDLPDCVWLTGARDDVPDLLRSLDLFVLPSLAEGISNTILEAMACGLPVIATDVGGNAELVVEGQTGCLVPAGDSIALAAALRHYADHPELLHTHGKAGRQRVEQQFSMESMVQAYLDVYDKVLGRA